MSGYTYKLSDVIRWGKQLAIGLEALQAVRPCGGIHLELSLQDVLLSTLGDVVISDSSIRIKGRQGESVGQPQGSIAMGGVWSIGACLYLLATKQGIQDEDSRAQAIQQVVACSDMDLEAFMEQALGRVWGTGPEAGVGSRARRALARVLAGMMKSSADGRMTAQLVADTLGKGRLSQGGPFPIDQAYSL